MKIDIDYLDFQSLILYAMRYALGRKTFAVSDVAEMIEDHMQELNKSTMELMVRDIEKESERHNLGMEMDKKIWLDLVVKLKGRLK
jgi:hypothetical protein